ncbi:hypothetical protein ACVWWU_000752 [Pantoea sp. PA1]
MTCIDTKLQLKGVMDYIPIIQYVHKDFDSVRRLLWGFHPIRRTKVMFTRFNRTFLHNDESIWRALQAASRRR